MGLFNTIGKALTSAVGGTPVGMLLNAGTSLIGSVISNSQQKANQNRQNEWQAEQAQISRDWQAEQAQLQNEWSEKMNLQQQNWQEDMWNKNNEYNTPQAQMERLMDAGINPNNAAGLVSGSASQSQMAQQPAIPSANPYPGTGIPSGGQMGGPTMLDAMNSIANARLVNAQAENMEIKNDYEGDILDATLDRIGEEIDEIRSRKDLNESQKNHIDNFLNEYYRSMQNKTNAEVRETNEKVKVLSEQVIQLHEQNENLKQQLKNLKEEQKQIQANTALLGQEAQESRKRTEGQDIQNQILGVEKQIKENEKIMSDKDKEFAEDTGINPQGPNGRDMLIYKTANNVVNNIGGKGKGERIGRLSGGASMKLAGKLHKAGYKYQSVPVTYNPPRKVKQPFTRGDMK